MEFGAFLKRFVGAALPALVVAGALMVSNLRIPKFSMRWSKPVNAFQGINMAIAYILVPLQMYPEYLFGLSFGFLLFGLTWGFLRADHAVNEESSAN